MRTPRILIGPGIGPDGDSVDHVIGTAVDVTSFKLAELELLRNREVLRASREEARDLSVPLSFLDKGKRYRAQVYRDGPDADWKTNPYAMVIEEKIVTGGENFAVWLAASGGVAVPSSTKSQGRSCGSMVTS